MKKTVIYLRVSTEEQDVASQRHALTEYCAAKGYAIDAEYKDVISGKTSSRPALDAMLEACSRGEVARIVALRIDRVSRSVSGFLALVTQLNSYGVGLICTAQNINTSAETAEGELFRVILSAFAQFERKLIASRVREGVAQYRADGTPWGRRPKGRAKDWERLLAEWRMEEPQPGYGELARRLGVSKSCAWRYANK